MSFRSLPRVFLPGLDVTQESYELPTEEVKKFSKVLRLPQGAEIAVLPNDGSLIRCSLSGNHAWPIATEYLNTEPKLKVTLIQALPKGDRLETVVRMGTELGVTAFVAFQAERSVARWEANKIADKRRRLEAIIRESAEQSFRSVLPTFDYLPDFSSVLRSFPAAVVLSELESECKQVPQALASDSFAFIVGPEGGWSPRELAQVGDRGVTLGPLVLRTDTAGIAMAAAMLLR